MSEFEYYYGDRVRIIGGFFNNTTGIVVDVEGEEYLPEMILYEVAISASKTKWFRGKDLVKLGIGEN